MAPGTNGASPRAPHRSPWSILASAVVPGLGQMMLRQKRGFAYLALESVAWLAYSRHVGDARRSRGAYRALAADVARAPFSAERPVGDFDYYERMKHFTASGVLSGAGSGVLEPETDTATFNGSMWILARRTYWSDPAAPPPRGSAEWNRAEAFYLERAIRPEYRWSWENAAGEHNRFRRLIGESNDAYRDALSHLGLSLGNHVLSTVDAYVTVRLRSGDAPRPGDGGVARRYAIVIELPFELRPPR